MVEFKYDIKLEDNTFQLREALEDWVKRVLEYWGIRPSPSSTVVTGRLCRARSGVHQRPRGKSTQTMYGSSQGIP